MIDKIKNAILNIRYKRYCPKCNIRMYATYSDKKYITLECPNCKSFLQIWK